MIKNQQFIEKTATTVIVSDEKPKIQSHILCRISNERTKTEPENSVILRILRNLQRIDVLSIHTF